MILEAFRGFLDSFRGFQRLLEAFGGFQRLFRGFQRLLEASRGFLRLLEAFQRLLDSFRGFQRLIQASRGFQRLLEASRGFQRLLKKILLFNPNVYCNLTKGMIIRKFVRIIVNFLLLETNPGKKVISYVTEILTLLFFAIDFILHDQNF